MQRCCLADWPLRKIVLLSCVKFLWPPDAKRGECFGPGARIVRWHFMKPGGTDMTSAASVTFAPPNPNFLAHPPAFIKLQAQALALPHHILSINEPFEQSYETALRKLRDEMGIETVITGDIAEVNGSPNWIRERSRPVGMKVHTPLWGRDRLTLLQQQLASGFKVIFSCVNTRWLTADWVGRELDDSAIADLRGVRDPPASICVARKASITRSSWTGRHSTPNSYSFPFNPHQGFAGLYGNSRNGTCYAMTGHSMK